MVILEKESHARKRGVPIYGFIKGIGFSSDGYNHRDYSPNPENLERAIKECIKDAGWSKEDIDYICLDAEATIQGDRLETKALKNVFGQKIKDISLSAPKSMFGNLLGAQTALDLVATTYSLEQGVIFPTINYQNPDPECDLDYTPNKAINREVGKALIVARGRGGINVMLAVEKDN